MANRRGKGNKVVSLGPGSLPATLAAALVEHHDDIQSIVAVVTWKSGDTEVFNTEQRNIDLVWAKDCMNEAIASTVHGDDGA